MTENPKNAFVAKHKAKAGTSKKVVDPDKLIQDIEPKESTTITATANKVSQDGNWVEDDDKGGILFGQDNKNSQPQKSIKKKAVPIATTTWADAEKNKIPQEEETPTPQPEAQLEHVVQTKKKILNLPGSKAKEVKKSAPTIDESDFVKLGEERKEQPKPAIVEKPVEKLSEKKPGGPPVFTNFKRSTVTTVQQEAQSNSATIITTTESKPTEDSKFKFSADKPRFISAKAGEPKIKEIQKSEIELAREQKEREIEERLQKEREELKKKEPFKFKKDTQGSNEVKPKEVVVDQTQDTQAEQSKFAGKGFINVKKKTTADAPNANESTNLVSQEKPAENGTNTVAIENKFVKKNGNPKKVEEDGDIEKKDKKQKKQERESENASNQVEIKKEEPKIIPAHEVIEVTSSNLTASSWDVGLKKIPKKK